MITFLHHQNCYAASLVCMALKRSFTHAAVQAISYDEQSTSLTAQACIVVLHNPSSDQLPLLKSLCLAEKNKIIICGKIPQNIAEFLSLNISVLPDSLAPLAKATPATRYHASESEAHITYSSAPLAQTSAIQYRALQRFDFANEWNNLGFGAVTLDRTIWSLAQLVELQVPNTQAVSIAAVKSGKQAQQLSEYIIEYTFNSNASLLFINRETALIDSHEWSLLETYVANYLPETHTCWPFISEIPFGYDAAFTMRLDCDEDIASAKPLYDYYSSQNIPFSLAVKTGLEELHSEPEPHLNLLSSLVENGGSILSHTVNHYPNWGENYQQALDEAIKSKQWIEKNLLKGQQLNYAVSPFHQNPDYAVQALDAAGYKGFVSGIIANDPQYILARGGKVSGELNIISHTQQCMLHGDCGIGNSVDASIYKQQFDQAKKANVLFGCLDHPFSTGYQYDWNSEAERISMHAELVNHVQQSTTVFLNENTAMALLEYKELLAISVKINDGNEEVYSCINNTASSHNITAHYKNKRYAV